MAKKKRREKMASINVRVSAAEKNDLELIASHANFVRGDQLSVSGICRALIRGFLSGELAPKELRGLTIEAARAAAEKARSEHGGGADE